MTPAARIQATFELLQSVLEVSRPADAIVSGYFRARRFIGSHDRNAIATRIYGILRHRARLNWWIGKFSPLPNPPQGEGTSLSRQHLLIWLALGEKIAVKNIAELCSGGKYAIAALDDSEHAFLEKISGSTIEHPDMPDDIKVECPPELAPALRKRFGKNFMREMRAMLIPAPLDLRINILKTTRDEILKAFKELGFKAEACALSPWGVRVYERPSLGSLAMLQNGLVEIQDEGSQIIALVVDAKPGERMIDFCAGAGGKTLAIAATMQNKGRVVACDTIAGRLKPSTERFRRAGLHNIETRVLASERDPWVKKHKGTFDRVLTDVPCSGIGTWRRNPDQRWRNFGPDLETLIAVQGEILDSASRLVRPGGRLIYSTCSLLPEENEAQIEKFLATHPEFSLSPCGLTGEDFLVLTPAQHGTDGFFAAVMVKEKIGIVKT